MIQIKRQSQVFIVLLATCLVTACLITQESKEKVKMLTANGTFEVNLTPKSDDSAPAGRMVIKKAYSGDMLGSGTGQMISKRTEGGAAVYYAIEEFSGEVNNKKGTFTLLHKGVMTSESQTLKVEILDGSGTEDLITITGSMEIIQKDNEHSYILSYSL